MNLIYLDNNSTTAIHPDVAAVMHECSLSFPGNPASSHSLGRKARRMVEDARDELVQMLGGDGRGMESDRLIFTSGGTESNNLAIRGLCGAAPSRILVSAIEHPSVLGPAESLRASGHTLATIPVGPAGVVDLQCLNGMLETPASLVSVMLANNETGVIQPVATLAERCRMRRVAIHTDAIQAVGKVDVHFRSLGVDAMSVSAHKFHGPVGIGALMLRHGVELRPILHGGFQQSGLRPGTESVALVVGFRQALRIAIRDLEGTRRRLAQLRDALQSELCRAIPQAVIHGRGSTRLPHTINVGFPQVDRQALVMALDLAGVACSTGSACASGSSEPSPVLRAMGISEELLAGSIRLGVSAFTTESEVAEAVRRIVKIVKDLQRTKCIASEASPAPHGAPNTV